MFGNFQQSQIRIEVNADAQILRESFLNGQKLSMWFFATKFEPRLPEKLSSGFKFTTWFGLVPIDNYVELLNDNCLRLLLSKAIDGYQEWYWGDGWVQSRLEGISLLPLNLGQTVSLIRLKDFISQSKE
jgi:hypothetical protein